MASCSLWLLLCGSIACATRSDAGSSPPAPACPEPAEPSPPTVSPPLLYDSYGVELEREPGDLYTDKVLTFVGPVMRLRVRYVDDPEGDIKQSSFTSCEAEVEVPIVWNERGFSVLQTITARGRRGAFVRNETPPDDDGSRNSSTDKKLRTCWVTLLEGDYGVDQQSAATTEGRAKQFRLTEPGGETSVLQAVPRPSELDLIDAVDAHFWR